MKIKSLKASVHRILLVVPLIEEGALKREMVFCEVETDDGIIGWGITVRLGCPLRRCTERNCFPYTWMVRLKPAAPLVGKSGFQGGGRILAIR